MKQIEATIMGQTYVLGCPEGGEASLMAAVAAVDREMCGIRDAGRVKARERIAVLAALNLAFSLEQRDAPPPVASAVNPHQEVEREAAPTIDLDAIVQRLDQVLGEDGRLL